MADMARINVDNLNVSAFGNLIEYRYTVYSIGGLNESEFLYNALATESLLFKRTIILRNGILAKRVHL